MGQKAQVNQKNSPIQDLDNPLQVQRETGQQNPQVNCFDVIFNQN